MLMAPVLGHLQAQWWLSPAYTGLSLTRWICLLWCWLLHRYYLPLLFTKMLRVRCLISANNKRMWCRETIHLMTSDLSSQWDMKDMLTAHSICVRLPGAAITSTPVMVKLFGAHTVKLHFLSFLKTGLVQIIEIIHCGRQWFVHPV